MRLISRDKPRRASLSPEERAVDMAVDAARVLLLVSAMLFPASLIPEGEIMIGVGQHMPFSFLPELEGDAIRFEDFFRRVVAEVSSPLVRCSRAPEQSAVLRSANPWNRLPAMPIKLNDSNSDAFSQTAEGVEAALIQAMQDDPQLAGF